MEADNAVPLQGCQKDLNRLKSTSQLPIYRSPILAWYASMCIARRIIVDRIWEEMKEHIAIPVHSYIASSIRSLMDRSMTSRIPTVLSCHRTLIIKKAALLKRERGQPQSISARKATFCGYA